MLGTYYVLNNIDDEWIVTLSNRVDGLFGRFVFRIHGWREIEQKIERLVAVDQKGRIQHGTSNWCCGFHQSKWNCIVGNSGQLIEKRIATLIVDQITNTHRNRYKSMLSNPPGACTDQN